jgi:hypothetical protein
VKYQPLFIASTGRAGSTLMMRILSCHPEILIRTLFPYETRAAQYYYISSFQEQKLPTFLPVKFKNAEYRPFNSKIDAESLAWSKKHNNVDLGKNGQNIINEYYIFLSEIENKSEAIYYAEKTIGLSLMKEITQSLENSKVIFLRRDPRDTFFSIKSFNAKRGSLTFGEEDGEEALFSRLITFYKVSIKLIETLKERAVVIRYEDMMINNYETLLLLFKKLGLNHKQEVINSIVDSAFLVDKNTKQHCTTSKGESSVSRWKQNANSRHLEMFDEFKKTLEILGYD